LSELKLLLANDIRSGGRRINHAPPARLSFRRESGELLHAFTFDLNHAPQPDKEKPIL